MQRVQEHLLDVTARPLLAIFRPRDQEGDEDEPFRATASTGSSLSSVEDVRSQSPITVTGCPGRSTSTIVSNSRLTLVLAPPPKSTSPFTGMPGSWCAAGSGTKLLGPQCGVESEGSLHSVVSLQHVAPL